MENKFEQQLSQLDIRLTERQKEQFISIMSFWWSGIR